MSYLIFGLLFCQAFVYTRAHRDCTETCDRRCYDLFKKSDANSFLGNGRLSTSRDCCLEFPNCESKGTANSCFTEQYRQYIVDTADQSQKHSCSPGQILTVNSWCPGHRRDGALICSEPCTALGVGIKRCFNGGNCVSNGASYYCVCAPGFTGPICYDDINECLSNPCQNGAKCHDHINEFRCECPPGKYGLLCDTDIDECASSPCQHGGTCTDHVNKYTCSCVAGYIGNSCELDCLPGTFGENCSEQCFCADGETCNGPQCNREGKSGDDREETKPSSITLAIVLSVGITAACFGVAICIVCIIYRRRKQRSKENEYTQPDRNLEEDRSVYDTITVQPS